MALAALATSAATPLDVYASHTGSCTKSSPSVNFASYPIHPVPAATVVGAEARLQNESLSVCTGASDDDKANWIWVAVGAAGGTYPRSIVQIGIGRCVAPNPQQNTGCDGTMNVLRAWGRDSGAPGCAGFLNQDPWVVRIGEPRANTYTVQKGGSSWQFVVGGSTLDTIPASNICWTGGTAFFFGESYDNGDAIGGFAGDPLSMTNALYQKAGQSWQSPSFGVGGECPDRSPGPPTYHCVTTNGQGIDFWTVQ